MKLILGELVSDTVQPTETAEIEIAESHARVILRDSEDRVMAAIGERTDGARVAVFADRALLDLERLSPSARKTVLNSIRWVGKSQKPKIGLGQSLYPFSSILEEADLSTRSLKTSELVDQVDCYCLAVRPNGGVFGEGQVALKRFVDAGGGLVLAGTGPEQQMKIFNDLISPAGIRFQSAALPTKNTELVVKADRVETNPESPDPPSQPVASRAMTEMIVAREKINLPMSADGPLGAALKLAEPANRGDEQLIAELRSGASLSGGDLPQFQEALYQLNLAVGPIIPTKEEPIIPGSDPLVDAIMEIETELNDTLPAEQIRKIPAADDYPGAVPEDAPRVAKTVAIDLNYKGWLPRNNGGGARANEWRPTGLYAPPGEVIRVTVPANLADEGLKVRIGAYGGILSEDWTKLMRYRKTARSFPIESKTTLAANGFGGIITIEVPPAMKGDEPDWSEIQIEGAVEAPLYVHGKTDQEKWDEIRKRPAPWAELASDRMILTLPSDTIRDLRNPDEVMEMWNGIVDASAVLAVLDRESYRAERIVFDRQLSNPGVGLHAGQPVAAPIGSAVETAITPELMHSPRAWGFLHELGHVHQDAAWNLPGSVEASCNLWSVYVSEELLGVPRAEAHRTTDPLARRTNMNAYFRDGAKFATDWERETALESYLQIQEAFGWEAYQKLLASYQDYDEPKRWNDQQEKNDEWVIRLSEICGVDLAPFYKTWGLPVSERAAAKTAKLPAWEEDPVARFRK